MDYGLWLLTDPSGQISLTGWSETSADATHPDTSVKSDHWPVYALCTDRAQLPDRLRELGLELDAGADLGDLDRQWDVYLRHPDITALRTQLDRERTANK